MLLTVRRSTADPEARGQVVGVADGRHPDTDPVAALDAWLAVRGPTPGAVFTILHGGSISLAPISDNAIARMLKARAHAAGLATDRSPSLAARRARHHRRPAGAGVERIAAQTRHRCITTLVEHYIRPLEALHTTISRDLGL